MPKSLNIQDIMEMLPHRFPFLLIDRVVELSDELDRVVAIKNVTMNEPQFTGHFPQAPVMPGVLIVEAMAQACAIIALSRIPEEVRNKSLFYFAGIDNARFKRPVIAGDQLIIEVVADRARGGIYKFSATATLDGEIACQADLMCAVRKLED